jgi:hypothetical protein
MRFIISNQMLMGVDVELQNLELTACGLEAALMRMEKLSKQERRDTEEPEDGDGPHGLVCSPDPRSYLQPFEARPACSIHLDFQSFNGGLQLESRAFSLEGRE